MKSLQINLFESKERMECGGSTPLFVRSAIIDN